MYYLKYFLLFQSKLENFGVLWLVCHNEGLLALFFCVFIQGPSQNKDLEKLHSKRKKICCLITSYPSVLSKGRNIISFWQLQKLTKHSCLIFQNLFYISQTHLYAVAGFACLNLREYIFKDLALYLKVKLSYKN